ncbi:sialate O-acetylesterase [Haloferula sp. BvORR071]|uniref:sialate O-acetylesterase n=1 Tax=Haloferula sp. BvORR071 TaxID=1396141 RepID=UPI0006987289|nr:sialate O-acetylesterase [Haloferula sp. BvORR071]
MRALFILLCLATAAAGEGIVLSSPCDYQVIQRKTKDSGTVSICGNLIDFKDQVPLVEIRVIRADQTGEWQPLTGGAKSGAFCTTRDLPAGGWYRIEARASIDAHVVAETATEHFAIGELFVIAGQSNSANYGEEKQDTATGLVASFDGQCWQLAKDPQAGASGSGGSFMPPLGDALAKRFGVPIGFVPCGIGSTSVREWLPAGIPFPNPPTRVERVKQEPDGQWSSDGKAFTALVARIKACGTLGPRAILWHQGESDANQADPTNTLAGDLYRQYLETIIRESRKASGHELPWFVAQASYHNPGDEGSPDIRAAQASLWKDGIALEGPDTDSLKGSLRENNGKGVHFSSEGLHQHASLWEQKISPWLEQQLK